MINGQKIVVVMPAYNAEQTLEKTYQALPHEVIDHVIVVDDASDDHTEQVARKLDGVHVIRHSSNMGYGANQKTCYRKALELGGDVVVMVHPDYQYEPRLVTAMASMIAQGSMMPLSLRASWVPVRWLVACRCTSTSPIVC